MKYKVIPPPPELSQYVKFFWTLESQVIGQVPHRLFADACPTMVFHYQNRFRSLTSKSKKDFPRSILHGHTCYHEDMITKDAFGIFGIYFFPMAIDSLFNTFPGELMNNVVSLADLMGSEGSEWGEKIVVASDNHERVELASNFLIKKARCITRDDELMNACLGTFIGSKGNASIEYLASKSTWSRRHLERRFRDTMGLTPKVFSRILRFQEVLKRYGRDSCQTLSDLAYGAGYFDQSHFVREFKLFSGMSPKEYFWKAPQTAEGFIQLS